MGADIIPAGAESTTVPQGTAIPTGEPENGTGENAESQEVQDVQAGGEPSGEGLPAGFDSLENAAKMYKDIQKLVSSKDTQYNELKTQLAAVEKYGGLDNLVQWADVLSQSPEFQEFVKGFQQKNVYGVDPNSLDEDSRQAIQLVEKVATQKAQEIVDAVLKEQVNPIVEKNRKENVQTAFAKLEEKYPKWREVADDMDRLSDELPPKIANNPSYKDIETLYLRALVESGRVDDFAAEVYKSKLQKLKSNSSEPPPTSTGAGKQPPARNIQEALARAKAAIGSGKGGL